MYTVSQAARLTGVASTTLRAWERRYGVIAPRRTDGGYRLYDAHQIELLREMAARVATGMRPAQAAASLASFRAAAPTPVPDADLVSAAATLDTAVLRATIERGFAGDDLEGTLTGWLLPQLERLGDAWADGRLSVAHEHFVSAQLMGALASAYDRATPEEPGPTVLVGLPAGARHELALLAFAICLRRLGADVVYLGADVPPEDWRAAAEGRRPLAAVLGVHARSDARAATAVAAALGDQPVALWVGGSARGLLPEARPLPDDVAQAARVLMRSLLGAPT